jgi:phosphoribosylanthranilate isomerase
MIRVKICGNRTVEDILSAVEFGADALGLIIGTKYYSEDNLSIEKAITLFKYIPPFVSSVIVTHLLDAEEILAIYDKIPTSTIQLHNEIVPKEIQKIREKLPSVKLIKAIHVTDVSSIKTAKYFEMFVDGILLDSRTIDRIGGTGKTHDWSISKQIVSSVNKPVILAGGLNPENISQAIQYVQPFGVDVNSGVDLPNGDKDSDKIQNFIRLSKKLKL